MSMFVPIVFAKSETEGHKMLISQWPHFTEEIGSKAKLGNQRDVDAFDPNCPVAVLSINSMMNVRNEEGGM